MSALVARHDVWVEEQQFARDAVDVDGLRRLLAEIDKEKLELRGTACALPFRAFSDSAGRYAIDAVLMRSERGIVALLHDDLWRVGDAFHIGMNGRIVRFCVNASRSGRRKSDAASLRVLYLRPAWGAGR